MHFGLSKNALSLFLASLVCVVGYFAVLSATKKFESKANGGTTVSGDEVKESRSLEYSIQSQPDAFYQPILSRPLFSPTRQPLDLKVDDTNETTSVETNDQDDLSNEVSNPEPARDIDVRLLGVISRDGVAQAYLSVEGATPIWIKKGDDIQGWTLEAFSTEWVLLRNGDEQKRVEFYAK